MGELPDSSPGQGTGYGTACRLWSCSARAWRIAVCGSA